MYFLINGFAEPSGTMNHSADKTCTWFPRFLFKVVCHNLILK